MYICKDPLKKCTKIQIVCNIIDGYLIGVDFEQLRVQKEQK